MILLTLSMDDSVDLTKRATGLPLGLDRAQFRPESEGVEGSTTKCLEDEDVDGSGSLGGEGFGSRDEDDGEELKEAYG